MYAKIVYSDFFLKQYMRNNSLETAREALAKRLRDAVMSCEDLGPNTVSLARGIIDLVPKTRPDGFGTTFPYIVRSTAEVASTMGRPMMYVVKLVARTLAKPCFWAIAIPSAIIVQYVRVYHPDYVRYLFSKFARAIGTFNADVDVLRSTFNNTPFLLLPETKNHSHGNSATVRSSATAFCVNLAATLGKEVCFEQRSRSDERHGYNGNRTYFWTKDLHTTPRWYDPQPNDLLCLVDVCYYKDMHDFLATNSNPVVLSTFQPHVAAGNFKDYSFTFDEYNQVHYTVAGGGKYVHKVWNYSVDHFTATTTFLGIPWRATSYLVDRKTTSENHELVLLTPVATWNVICSFILSFLSTNTLATMRLMQSSHLRLRVQTKDTNIISTALPNQFVAANVPAAVDDTINNLARMSTNAITCPTIEANLGVPTTDNQVMLERKAAAVILQSYYFSLQQQLFPTLRRMIMHQKPDVVFPIAQSAGNYQYNTYEPNAKPSMKPFMTPLLVGAFSPDKTIGNEKQAIDKRIIAVKSDAPATPFIDLTTTEFVQFLFPVPHPLFRETNEAVVEQQSRPSQRRILAEAEQNLPWIRRLKTFIKSEAYLKLVDLRIIFTINGVDKCDYFSYIYPLADYCKQFPWYVFGATPREIASRVTLICGFAQLIMITDFSRFDGTLSAALRSLEKKVLARGFQPCDTAHVLSLNGAMYDIPAVTTFGLRAPPGKHRASGEPGTSVMNTLANAYNLYYHLRRTKVGSDYYQPQEAWDRLNDSLFGGDDGATAAVTDVKHFIRTSSELGLNAKAELLPRGSYGVQFLSRKYGSKVWFGETTSTCDVKKALSKLHLSTVKPDNVLPTTILQEKMVGLRLSDPNTPIIGHIALKVHSLNPGYQPTFEQWNSDAPPDEQYPNHDFDTVNEIFAMEMGSDPEPLHRILRFLENVVELEEMLAMPLLYEPKEVPPQDVAIVVNHETVLPLPPKKQDAPGKIRRRERAKNFALARKGARETKV
jgi:hypothetical protein